MVTKQDILGYVSFTPYNTNVNVLSPMLDEFGTAPERKTNSIYLKLTNNTSEAITIIASKTADSNILSDTLLRVGDESSLAMTRYEEYDFKAYISSANDIELSNAPEGVTFSKKILTVSKTCTGTITLVAVDGK